MCIYCKFVSPNRLNPMEYSKVEISKQLESAVLQLIARVRSLRAENEKLSVECQRLQARLDVKTAEVDEANHRLETFRIASTLRGSQSVSKQVKDVKSHISQIVHEIDQCIALLKQ